MRLSGMAENSPFFRSTLFQQQVSGAKSMGINQNSFAAQQNNQDSVQISPQGKQSSLIKQLMDQKQFVQECKEAEIQRGLDSGFVDQQKLDEYDKQLEALEQQITEACAQESVNEKEETASDSSENKVITKDEYEKRKIMDMMEFSYGMDRSEVVFRTKNKMDGEARVLKAEIKADGDRALESKRKRVAEIEAKSATLMDQVGKEMKDIQEAMENTDDVVIQKEEETEENKQETPLQSLIQQKEESIEKSIPPVN